MKDNEQNFFVFLLQQVLLPADYPSNFCSVVLATVHLFKF